MSEGPCPPPSGNTPFERLVNLMATLRAHCPWDKEQTHQSLTPYLIEEAYEVFESIERGSDDPGFNASLREELGDLLLQVVFHAQLAREADRFTIDDVAQGIVDKMVRRHPHVFGDVTAETPGQVRRNWEEIKAQEKAAGGKPRVSLMDGIPRHLPALLAAERVSSRAAEVGFEWSSPRQVIEKVNEEAAEVLAAFQAGDVAHAREEMGDLLFACANVCRMMGFVSEDALRAATAKFVGRFAHVEGRAAEGQRPVSALSDEEMRAFWEESKNAP